MNLALHRLITNKGRHWVGCPSRTCSKSKVTCANWARQTPIARETISSTFASAPYHPHGAHLKQRAIQDYSHRHRNLLDSCVLPPLPHVHPDFEKKQPIKRHDASCIRVGLQHRRINDYVAGRRVMKMKGKHEDCAVQQR